MLKSDSFHALANRYLPYLRNYSVFDSLTSVYVGQNLICPEVVVFKTSLSIIRSCMQDVEGYNAARVHVMERAKQNSA